MHCEAMAPEEDPKLPEVNTSAGKERLGAWTADQVKAWFESHKGGKYAKLYQNFEGE
jgi:hypothetical protein